MSHGLTETQDLERRADLGGGRGFPEFRFSDVTFEMPVEGRVGRWT